jgi:hypothetical protein
LLVELILEIPAHNYEASDRDEYQDQDLRDHDLGGQPVPVPVPHVLSRPAPARLRAA